MIHRQQGAGKFAAKYGMQCGQLLPVTGSMQTHRSIDRKFHSDLRIGDGNPLHHAADGSGFRRVPLEEFHPCRRIVKQIPHRDAGSERTPDLFAAFFLRTLNTVPRTGKFLCRSGNQLYLCNSGHRRQGLASKAKG